MYLLNVCLFTTKNVKLIRKVSLLPIARTEEPRGCLEFAEESASFVLGRWRFINQGVWPDVSACPIIYLKNAEHKRIPTMF